MSACSELLQACQRLRGLCDRLLVLLSLRRLGDDSRTHIGAYVLWRCYKESSLAYEIHAQGRTRGRNILFGRLHEHLALDGIQLELLQAHTRLRESDYTVTAVHGFVEEIGRIIIYIR